mgnify:CR=1 FL=1
MRPRLPLTRCALALLAATAFVLPAGLRGCPAAGCMPRRHPRSRDSLTWDPAVRRGVLPNGIRWFIKKNAQAREPRVAAARGAGRLDGRGTTTSRASRTSPST